MALDSKAWKRLSPWLDQALDLEGDARERWLTDLAKGDPALAGELRSWLAGQAAVEAAGFLEERAGAPEAATLAGRRIGAYTLIEPIGSGGMGSVWLAQRNDGRFEGRMAIKLLHAGFLRQALVERFRREGSILGKLSHPNIARLIDAGVTNDEHPYLVLEHVAGQRIDTYADERSLDLGARLQLFIQVLDAVQHAHTRLVVHRDLKPGNVMVDTGGTVKLLDFGIAKLIDEEGQAAESTELTREGGRALTPLYAAPEQNRGEAVTTATDVYALGLLLYVLLTGQHPRQGHEGRALPEASEFPRASAAVVDTSRREAGWLLQAARCRGATPARLSAQLAGDLDNVLAKALRLEPAERYVTAAAFAEDLRRHLAGETVSARPDSWAYRASRFVKRHRYGVGTAAVAALAVCASALLAAQQAQEARAQQAIAAQERDRALSEQRMAISAGTFLAELIGVNGPDGRPMKAGELVDHGERLAREYFPDEPDTLSLVLDVLISKNINLNRWSEFERQLSELEALAPKTRSPVWTARASCLRHYSAEGPDATRLRQIERAIDSLPPPDSPFTAATRGACEAMKGRVLSELGRYDEALAAMAKAAASTQAYAGLSRLFAAENSGDLAVTLWFAGRYAESEREFLKQLAVWKARHKAKSLDAAMTHNFLSNLYSMAGSPMRGAEQSRAALAAAGAGSAGAHVPHYIAGNYWVRLYEAGDWKAALQFARGEVVRQSVGSPQYSPSQTARQAMLAHMRGQEAEALRLAEAALTSLDPATAQRLNWIVTEWMVRLLADQGRTDEALKWSRWASDTLPRLARQPDKLEALTALIHAELGDFDAAAGLAQRVLSAAPGYMPQGLPNTVEGQAHLALARALASRGDTAGSGHHARAALAHFEGALMPTHPLTRAARALVPR